MDMCYDGTLVMPSNCVVMDEEEMTYVEAGWSPKKVLKNAVGLMACAGLGWLDQLFILKVNIAYMRNNISNHT